ncbi:PLP-dependent transferase [Hymenopellis radicata]|nr:PLP-dependent transferase [Hymenopellis radicata]
MSLLFKKLRVHQVFGANTDVGKTILTSALVRASAGLGEAFYLKPVSTGPPGSADTEHIQRYAGQHKQRVHTECLYQYQEPVSPHLAARLAAGDDESLIPTDATVVNSIAHHIRKCAAMAAGASHMYVETAGGVHSPTLSGTTQLDCYRPLFLPTVLVGDSKLGGISSTISAYESLLLRGYIVDAILLFRDEYYRNWEYLRRYFADRGVHVSTSSGDIMETVNHLDARHTSRLSELESMPRRSLDTFWWPFVQHAHFRKESDVNVIDSAHSDFFTVYRPQDTPQSSVLQPQFDGSASWWTQAFGHAHPSLTLAAARASGRYGHVMFPRASHLPALHLAERLVKDGPGKGWASRAFFSDDGSTAMEVALKMALRAYTTRQGDALNPTEKKNVGILGLKGSYHGDTIGAMNACEEGDQLEGEVLSWAYDVPARLTSRLAMVYRSHIEKTLEMLRSKGTSLGALVLEPLILGAGGMMFIDPLFQRVLVDVVREMEATTDRSSWSGMPVIFDEVFVGLYRIGMESTTSILGVTPDISVNAKILTGGLVPLAVTLASNSIYEAFLSDTKADALLHGHSYTAHAVGCEVANETFKLLDGLSSSELWAAAKMQWSDGSSNSVWSFWDPRFVDVLSHLPVVEEVMTLGTVLAIKLKDDNAGYVSQSAEAVFQPIGLAEVEGTELSAAPGGQPFGVHFRTLGNVAYFITSLNTSATVLRSLEDKIWLTLQPSK